MNFELPSHRKEIVQHGRWSGAAFLIEAMLLLVFVMASLAVLTQMFATASDHANRSRDLTDAVAATSTVAERFAADPSAVPEKQLVGTMYVTCLVSAEHRAGGTLYNADISAYSNEEDADRALTHWQGLGASQSSSDILEDSGSASGLVYSIDTSKYESGV